MRRRPFTIIEVMIAISIVATLGVALAMNFHGAHQERQEKDATDIIESKFRLAAQLAKISGRKVRVVFGEEKGVKNAFIASDIKVSERMKANFSSTVPLHNVRDVEIHPGSGKGLSVIFYPWGLYDPDSKVEVFFHSGKKATLLPGKYMPNVVIEDQGEIDALYPQEVAEDEKEET